MGKMRKDKTGMKFGRLLVLERSLEKYNNKHAMYLCRCDCGTESLIVDAKLLPHLDSSCGCKLRELRKKRKEQTSFSIARRLEALKKKEERLLGVINELKSNT